MITVTKNPVDDSDITIVSGVIETVKITKLKTPDSYKNTHKASLKIGDDWINVGAYKSTVDSLTTQDAKKNWIEVKEGQSVKFAVIPRVYQGKIYYDVKRTNIKVANGDSVNAVEATKATKAAVMNAGQSKQQSNTNTPIKPENASKADVKRFYGVLKSADTISGGYLLEIVALDKTTEIGEPIEFVLNASKSNPTLVGGSRANFKYIVEGDKNIITEFVKVYDAIQTVSQKTKVVAKSKIQDAPFGSKERQLKMNIGNMFNVAVNAVGIEDLEKTYQFAYNLFPLANKLREDLIEEYKEVLSDNDVGSKLGDSLKAAANHLKNKGSKFSENDVILYAYNSFAMQFKLDKDIFEYEKKGEGVEKVEVSGLELRESKVLEVAFKEEEKKQGKFSEPILDEPRDWLDGNSNNFEDDIPFSPIGLQHRELLSCM